MNVVTKQGNRLTTSEELQLSKLRNEGGQMQFLIEEGFLRELTVTLASIKNKIVGWAYYVRDSVDEPEYEVGVFVDPKYRNKGIGGKLVAANLNHLRSGIGDEEPVLIVSSRYLIFRSIMRRLGFRYRGRNRPPLYEAAGRSSRFSG